MLKWIESNSYEISGPTREVYLRPANNGSQTDPDTVTEIQFPVRQL
jgi:effector-binding domain-containing protein